MVRVTDRYENQKCSSKHNIASTQALLVAALVLVARAQARAVVQEDVKGVTTILQDEARDDPFFDPNPQYDFAYRIHDAETGDAKVRTRGVWTLEIGSRDSS